MDWTRFVTMYQRTTRHLLISLKILHFILRLLCSLVLNNYLTSSCLLFYNCSANLNKGPHHKGPASMPFYWTSESQSLVLIFRSHAPSHHWSWNGPPSLLPSISVHCLIIEEYRQITNQEEKALRSPTSS